MVDADFTASRAGLQMTPRRGASRQPASRKAAPVLARNLLLQSRLRVNHV
jgi:hypothetical protein